MNSNKSFTTFVLATILAVFSSSSFAANITNVQSGRAVNQWQDMTAIPSNKTRAEVRTELSQTSQRLTSTQQEYVDFANFRSQNFTTRAAVKSELGKSTTNSVLQPSDIYFGG